MRSDPDTLLARSWAVRTPLSPLPMFEYSTRDLPRKEQFAAWRNSLSPILDLVQPDVATVGFDGRQMVWDLGSLAFARIRTDAFGFSSLSRHTTRDPLDHWMLTLLLRGNMNTITPNKAVPGHAGVVQVHALGRGFMGQLSDAEALLLFIPRDTCPELGAALDAAEFSALATGMGYLLSDYMADLAKRLAILEAENLPALLAATKTMIQACLSPSDDNIEEARSPISVALFERARRIVQARLYEPGFGAETIRRELGISRTRLYSLFEASGGVVRYIQHRRLLDAHALLSDPGDRRLILEVAEQCGFSDGAEFGRAFKREFGYSPSEVRKGAKGTIGDAASRLRIDLEELPAGERLGGLLRRLQA